MPKVRESRYWETLLERYPRSPSIALCRVPEVEYLAALDLQEPVLDHCCGDAYIADVCFPGRKLDAGVDLSEPALAIARQRGKYARVLHADAGKHIPAADGSFGTIFNNSGIEHIDDLDGAIREIARVLRPGGTVHMNVLNSRYFDWWPHPRSTADDYRRYQPFHHALDEAGWTAVLQRHGLGSVRFRDYFPRPTAQVLADYDYRYSAFYFRRRLSPAVGLTVLAPQGLLRDRWRRLFGELEWQAQAGQGAGFMVSATRGA
jgi:SAM-dependent methyltransferase